MLLILKLEAIQGLIELCSVTGPSMFSAVYHVQESLEDKDQVRRLCTKGNIHYESGVSIPEAILKDKDLKQAQVTSEEPHCTKMQLLQHHKKGKP